MQNCQVLDQSAESGVRVSQAKCRPRVVVVDDEHIVADTLAEILSLHGYEAKALYSGEAAVEGAEEFKPETVLIDVRMQGIDGVEAAIQIRKLLPTCRIILFTASPVRHALQARISLLGFEFLQRPLHPWDVLSLLRKGVKPLEVEL
jgi:CheY-like chemotaxis protein